MPVEMCNTECGLPKNIVLPGEADFWALITNECRPTNISLDNFGTCSFGDGDCIKLNKVDTTDPDLVCFQLRLSGSVDWFKEIQINRPCDSKNDVAFWKQSGIVCTKAATEHKNHTSGPICVPAGQAQNELVFVKAKLFGIHTCVYKIPDLRVFTPGNVWEFEWWVDGP